MPIIRCPHCGTANREGSNFCNSCGVELRGESDTPENSLNPQPAADTSSQQPPAHKLSPDNDASEVDATDDSTLQMDFVAEETEPFAEEEDTPATDISTVYSAATDLLAPVNITVNDDEFPTPASTSQDTDASQVDLLRRIRMRMSSPPRLAGFALPGASVQPPRMNIRWLFGILAIAVILPALFVSAWPSGTSVQWPGVSEAYTAIDALPPNANVLVYWAFDPSTEGELSLDAMPITVHLFQKHSRMSIISQLPAGPASARRLVADARLAWQRSEELSVAVNDTWQVPIAYLPGGAATLALVAQDSDAVFSESARGQAFGGATLATDAIDLVVIYAAHADDVQHWLEQVRPQLIAPTIAVVAAGADPSVRPYYDSRQIVGLVSGFDGADNYQKLLEEEASRLPSSWLDKQLVLQDWGHFVFLLAIVLGNFRSILRHSEKG